MVFKFVPAMCPDGIFLGNSRCTLLGADLNRSWDTANEHHHPVLWKVKQLILNTHNVRIFDVILKTKEIFDSSLALVTHFTKLGLWNNITFWQIPPSLLSG